MPCCPFTTDGGIPAYQLFLTARYTSRMYGLKSTPCVPLSISIPHPDVTPLGREAADCSVTPLLTQTPAVWVATNGIEAARAKTTSVCDSEEHLFSWLVLSTDFNRSIRVASKVDFLGSWLVGLPEKFVLGRAFSITCNHGKEDAPFMPMKQGYIVTLVRRRAWK